MLEESAGETVEDNAATEGEDEEALPPWLVCGVCCLTCGLGTILGGGFSTDRIYCGMEANVSDKM